MTNQFLKLESASNYGTDLLTADDCENDLRNNYITAGHPVAFSGINTIFNYYKGLLNKERIKNVLSSIESYTLHREFQSRQRNPTFAHFKRYQFQMDLVDVQNTAEFNDGIRYLLTCIDIFTRKAFARGLLAKDAKSVLKEFKSILLEAVEPPLTLCFDRGTEFRNNEFNTFCQQNNIQVRTPDSSIHAAFVERFNLTLQRKIEKYKSEYETQKYIDVLPKLLETYNNALHRMTGVTPNEAETDESVHLAIRLRQSKQQEKIKKRLVKFQIGDEVRIAKIKGKFGRGYHETANPEIFRIYRISTKLKIPMYTLETYDGKEIINGAFYDFEITKKTGDTFRIEKVIKTDKKNKRLYVKWKGFNDTYNAWIPESNVVKNF